MLLSAKRSLWGQAFHIRSSQALEVTGTVRFHRKTNLFPSRCENSFFRDTFVLLLDNVFMLLGFMLKRALTVHLVIQTKNVWPVKVREEKQSPQKAQDFVVVFALCVLQLFVLFNSYPFRVGTLRKSVSAALWIYGNCMVALSFWKVRKQNRKIDVITQKNATSSAFFLPSRPLYKISFLAWIPGIITFLLFAALFCFGFLPSIL